MTKTQLARLLADTNPIHDSFINAIESRERDYRSWLRRPKAELVHAATRRNLI